MGFKKQDKKATCCDIYSIDSRIASSNNYILSLARKFPDGVKNGNTKMSVLEHKTVGRSLSQAAFGGF